MTHPMYDEQRKKIDALFRAHAEQEVAEKQDFLERRAFAYATWLPRNRAPVHLLGRPLSISTAPYTMHTMEEIAILQHAHAVRAMQQQHGANEAPPVTMPRAAPRFHLPSY